LRPVADGRIFTGRQALKMGLVDELGDMERSVDVAANLAGIKGKPEVVYPRKRVYLSGGSSPTRWLLPYLTV